MDWKPNFNSDQDSELVRVASDSLTALSNMVSTIIDPFVVQMIQHGEVIK